MKPIFNEILRSKTEWQVNNNWKVSQNATAMFFSIALIAYGLTDDTQRDKITQKLNTLSLPLRDLVTELDQINHSKLRPSR
jgi:hypothetical protein